MEKSLKCGGAVLHKLQLHLVEVEVVLAGAAESAFDQYELQLEQSTLRSACSQQKISGELNSDFIQQQPSFYFDSIVLNSATLSCYPP